MTLRSLRTLRTYFTQLGAALPTANPTKHGQLNIKRASATEDEAYLVLRDASGVLQYRRLTTTTLGDTLYATLAHLHESTYVNVTGDTMTGDLFTQAARIHAQADSTQAFAVKTSGGLSRLRVDTTNNEVELWSGTDLIVYSGSGSGVVASIDGATGDTLIAGALDHDGTTVGLFGVTPAVRPAAYTVTNGITDRTYDADVTSTAELADVLGTLIADLRTLGIVQ